MPTNIYIFIKKHYFCVFWSDFDILWLFFVIPTKILFVILHRLPLYSEDIRR